MDIYCVKVLNFKSVAYLTITFFVINNFFQITVKAHYVKVEGTKSFKLN